MRALRYVVVALSLSCMLASQTSSAAAQVRQTEFAQVEAQIPMAPTAFRGNGAWHLCYEIHFTNLNSAPYTLQNISVMNESGTPLLNVDSKALPAILYHPSRMPSEQPAAAADLAPGETVIAYMWIDLAQNAAIPTRLQHQLQVRKAGETKSVDVQSAATAVATELPQIAPPLHGKTWVAGSAPSNSSPHRRTIIVYDGKPYIAQRYAIDWVQFGPDNKTYTGNPKDNHSYHCFGLEAYAVADATVVEVKDGLPENVPEQKPAVPINFETVAGNHVNVDLGGGVYAMYAHLQPGSIRVKVGDRVTVGQVIGLVGNTGNSSEPHLHFQLMNHNNPLGSDGLPYTFATFYAAGKMTMDGNDFKLDRTPSKARHGEIPMENQIVDFEP
jgi:peptidase M23-like protein